MFKPMKRTACSVALLIGGTLLRGTSPAPAQINRGLPEELQGVGVDEKLDELLPLELWFQDSDGKSVQLQQLFGGRRPVILTFNYFRCPMLCTLQLNGLVDALREIDLDPGEDFEILSISFDPLESPPLAASKKKTYMEQYARPGAARGWRFMTGKSDAIRTLTAATGFHYKWNEQAGEWAHKATLIVCTPDGRISRYMGGVMFDPPTLRMSLVEASQGKIGTIFDAVFLSCFHYISKDGRYTASVMGIMRLGGVLTMVALGGVLLFFWRFDARRRRQAAAAVVGERSMIAGPAARADDVIKAEGDRK